MGNQEAFTRTAVACHLTHDFNVERSAFTQSEFGVEGLAVAFALSAREGTRTPKDFSTRS